MTCACSRHSYALKDEREDVSLHCKENGNYENLQCDNGLCWCVEPMTGEPTQRSYPESVMTYLPCFNKKFVGSQYLRRCESKSLAIAKIRQKIGYHGHKYFHLDNVTCDTDGSYGRYKVDRNIVRCVWKDGKQIENYQTTTNNIGKLNCNCARDSYASAESNIEFLLICESNGNYKPLQNINGYAFCVDEDGFATGIIGGIGENIICGG